MSTSFIFLWNDIVSCLDLLEQLLWVIIIEWELPTEDVGTDVGQTASLVSQFVVTPHKMLAQCKVGESHRSCSAQRETENKT